MKISNKLVAIVLAVILPASLAGCSKTDKQAIPMPTGTAAYYVSLKAANLDGTKYLKPKAAVQLGQLVCENLAAKHSVMWVIKNIVTLNGSDTPAEFTPQQRSKFAMGVIASAVTHLCPELKDYVLPPQK
ncbi:MAG: DUF732 domain-containing protein [Actinomycetales bacterium]|nr:DUF732 domain-containing protein [Actinomycetales bacterium]